MNQLSASDSLPVLANQRGSFEPPSDVLDVIRTESLAVPSADEADRIWKEAFADGILAGLERLQRESGRS